METGRADADSSADVGRKTIDLGPVRAVLGQCGAIARKGDVAGSDQGVRQRHAEPAGDMGIATARRGEMRRQRPGDGLARLGPGEVGEGFSGPVIAGDPSVRASDINNVETVFKQGVGYDPAKLIASVTGKAGLY